MKKVDKIGNFLWVLGGVGILLFTLYKVLNGEAFTRYRTAWLYELDYLSLLLIVILPSVTLPIYFLVIRRREQQAKKEIEEQLIKQRKAKAKTEHVQKNT